MRFLSWLVTALCYVLVYYILHGCIWLAAYLIGLVAPLALIWRIALYIFAGGTLIGLVLAPVVYGGTMIAGLANMISPSRNGARYIAASVVAIGLSLILFISLLSGGSVNIMLILYMVFCVVAMVTGIADSRG